VSRCGMGTPCRSHCVVIGVLRDGASGTGMANDMFAVSLASVSGDAKDNQLSGDGGRTFTLGETEPVPTAVNPVLDSSPVCDSGLMPTVGDDAPLGETDRIRDAGQVPLVVGSPKPKLD
jgi:hypothetical protein